MKTKSAKPPVKMLIVHAQPNSRDGGGSFRVLSYFLKGIDRERFEVHVVLSVLDRVIGEAKTEPIRFLEAYASKLHLFYVPMNQARASVRTQLKFLVELIASTWALWRLMRREHFEIVYTNSLNIFASGIAARLAGITSVYHTHEIVRKPRIIAQILARVVGALADRIICVSEAAKAPFLEVGVAADKLLHVPNCIDLDEFDTSRQGQKVREEFAANGYEKLVASVGRLIPKKGHDYVIQAAKRVVAEYPKTRFLIVGDSKWSDDGYVESLVSQVKEMGLEKHVVLTGPRKDIPEIMAAVDLVVLASSSEVTPEAAPLVILEALAMGTPVVASKLGGIPEMLPDGENGYLVPPRDAGALADGILRLLQNEQKARAMGRAGQAWVRQNCNAVHFSGKIQNILLQTLKKDSAASLLQPDKNYYDLLAESK